MRITAYMLLLITLALLVGSLIAGKDPNSRETRLQIIARWEDTKEKKNQHIQRMEDGRRAAIEAGDHERAKELQEMINCYEKNGNFYDQRIREEKSLLAHQ